MWYLANPVCCGLCPCGVETCSPGQWQSCAGCASCILPVWFSSSCTLSCLLLAGASKILLQTLSKFKCSVKCLDGNYFGFHQERLEFFGWEKVRRGILVFIAALGVIWCKEHLTFNLCIAQTWLVPHHPMSQDNAPSCRLVDKKEE